VAVSADDVALRDLVQDFLPVPACELVGDLESLVAQVIELEDHRIDFAAIGAWVSSKELDQIPRPLFGALSLSFRLRIGVLLPVREIVLPTVGGAAWRTHVVSLPFSLSAPGELLYWLELPATTARS
jgi:hypothetical protein